jgi:hypothetical protein
MSSPAIIMGHAPGVHNSDLAASAERIERSKSYRDLSTVCVIPTRGRIDARVVESWWSLMTPMNQPFIRITVRGMEVAEAYNSAIEQIFAHPQLKDWRYLLTLEEDNMPPPDGLLRLLENIDDYDIIGGLYWTKGIEGQPMIYGAPGQVPMFAPQPPRDDELVECNGLGMGFTLFRLDIFQDLPKPWFVTQQEWDPAGGAVASTQDLYFFKTAREHGLRVACDCRVKVGHYDAENDIVW